MARKLLALALLALAGCARPAATPPPPPPPVAPAPMPAPAPPRIFGAAAFDRTSRNVFIASRSGVPPIANTASPQAGPNGTAALQALLSLNDPGGPLAGQPLEVIVDIPILCSNVGVGSNDILTGTGAYEGQVYNGTTYTGPIAPAGLWMATVAAGQPQCCVLKNLNWASTYNSGSPASSSKTPANITDHDILIRNLYIDGGRRYGVSGNAEPRVNPTTGQVLIPLFFAGVSNLRIRDISVFDASFDHVFTHNCIGLDVDGLRVCDPVFLYNPALVVANRNTGGIDIIGPQLNARVRNLYGTTGDDFYAIGCGGGQLSMTNGLFLGPSGFGGAAGFAVVYCGSVANVSLDGVYPYFAADCGRIDCAGDPRTSVFQTAKNITINKLVGSALAGFTSTDLSFYGLYGTNCVKSGIVLSNWNVHQTVYAPGLNAILGGIFTDFHMIDCVWGDFAAGSPQFGIILTESGLVMSRMRIRGLRITEDSAELSSVIAPIQIPAGTIGDISFVDCGWSRASATTVPFVWATGGTIASIAFSGCDFNNISTVLQYSPGASIASVTSSGLTHRGAGGAASFIFSNATPLARFRAGGSNTLLLQSGTAPTSSKTDGTEG